MTPRADRPGSGARREPWRVALSLFTVFPVGGGPDLDEAVAARAVYWLPAVGLLLGVVAAGAMVLVQGNGASPYRQLLGAAVALALLGLLTGGLHLDGLADTADGLGSRRPAADALAIMRRSDTGPLGVASLVLVLLIQVTALAAVPRGLAGAAALVLAVVTGRVGVVLATGAPAARPGGFGALVAGRTRAGGRALTAVLLICATLAGGVAVGGWPPALRGAGAALAGLLAGGLLTWVARRRLGGLTGDVFGAIIELTAAVVLLVLALSS
jgi:adenosylcobinamide-GDP ribazoletransferase